MDLFRKQLYKANTVISRNSLLALQLIYPDNEEYYRSLVDVIWGILNEYTWAPLGHYNSYYDRTPKDFDPGLIDIFAASLAFSLAEIKSLFKERRS